MPRLDDVQFGAPCWFDLSTSDLDGAKAFYGDLFGWNAVDMGPEFGNYHVINKDGADLGGLMTKSDQMPDMPDSWTMYIAVEDAQATANAARDAGAQIIVEPVEIGPQGSMAVLADPTGGVFGLWQPGTRRGFELYNEADAPVWFELMTRDFAAATDFYANVFGSELVDVPMGDDGPGYKTFTFDGQQRAGMMDGSLGALPEGVPSNWLVYFGVKDTDATVAKALELGGSVLVPAKDTPQGRFAVLGDSTGAPFGVISVDE